jgi:hypothetical protein
MASRTQYRQETARLLSGADFLESTASTNTTATEVILADYTSSIIQDKHFIGFVMYVSYDAGGLHAAPEGEYKRITDYDASAGKFTVESAFTAAVTASDKVEIHRVIHPTLIHESLDYAFRNSNYRTIAVPSALADADMEASTSGWTAGSGCTLTRTTIAGEYFRGLQANKVLNTGAATSYAYQRVNAVAGDTGYVVAICRNNAITTSCKLVVYDYTNSAEIDSETSAEFDWQSLGIQFTVPTDCHQIEFRLQTVTATTNAYSMWDQVQLLWQGQRRYAMPSWVTEEWQVGRTVYQLEGSNFASDGHMIDRTPATRWEHIRAKKELGTVYIAPDPPFNNARPVYVECLRPYAALSTDASTCDADLDWIALKAACQCLEKLSAPMIPERESKGFQKALDRITMKAAAAEARFQPKIEQPWGFGEEELFRLQQV